MSEWKQISKQEQQKLQREVDQLIKTIELQQEREKKQHERVS